MGPTLLALLFSISPATLLEEGRAAAARGSWEVAAKRFTRCLELDGRNAECTLELSRAYIELGEDELGRGQVRRYMELSREPAQSRQGYRDVECERRAEESISGTYSVDRDPQSPEAEDAAAALKRGNAKKAAAIAKKCVERDEADADCHLQLARAQLVLRANRSAWAHFTRFCQLNDGESAVFNGAPQKGLERRKRPAEFDGEDW